MTTMPVVFVGHGNPLNAIETNDYTRGWAALAADLPRPTAILSVSAHWYVPGSRVSVNEAPPTIHDFGGFPPELFAYRYPAPGSPSLADRVAGLLAPVPVELDAGWGLDHGTWSVLTHMYPDAEIPVVQLGIDETLSAAEHYALARRLDPLRDEGVLIFCSGNVVHNLHAYSWGRHPAEPYDWAVRFETRLRELVGADDAETIVGYESMGEDAMLSAPTPDHFLPFLYAVAQCRGGEAVTYPVDGFDGGSISMLSMRIG